MWRIKMQVHTHSTLTKHTCMWKTSLDVNRLQLFFPNSWLCMMKSRWSLKHRWGKHYNRTQIIWSSHESWVVFNGWCSHPRNFLGKVLLCIFTMGILLIWFLLFLVTTPPLLHRLRRMRFTFPLLAKDQGLFRLWSGGGSFQTPLGFYFQRVEMALR